MSKIYKGYELIKEIAIGNIKNDTKIIPHYPNNDCTVEYYLYRYGFMNAYYKDYRRSDSDVNVCVFLDNNRTFEVIEDEIDIDNIKELTIGDISNIDGMADERMKNKFNELIKAVKYLNKKIKEKE